MKLLLDFNNPALLDVSISGGKGANLARLTQAGFKVPPGIVLPPRAYRAFISQDSAFADKLKELPDDPSALENACQAVCENMRQWPLPETLRNELETALAQFPSGTAFSIRSSATAEVVIKR